MVSYRGIKIIPEDSQQFLGRRQQSDYEVLQKQLVDWLLDKGKDPEQAVGYSQSTVQDTVYKSDRFYRYVWTELEDGYTTYLTLDHAEDFLINLAFQDLGQSYKRGYEKALKRFYSWRHHVRGGNQWDIEFSFDPPDQQPPQAVFTADEQRLLREAPLKYGSLPSYPNVLPAERDRWKEYLAQRLGKPKSEISREDWEQANSWKIPSLVWTSIDAGLKPKEVERASVSWIDWESETLRVPEPGSENVWDAVLQEQTVDALENWINEREYYEKYTDSDLLWLTKHGNPYQTDSLNYIFKGLCRSIGVDPFERGLSWGSLRDSVAVYLVERMSLSDVQEQLRIKSSTTVARYKQGDSNDGRRSVVERMS